MGRLTLPQIEEVRYRYWNLKHSIGKIAENMGISEKTVRKYVKDRPGEAVPLPVNPKASRLLQVLGTANLDEALERATQLVLKLSRYANLYGLNEPEELIKLFELERMGRLEETLKCLAKGKSLNEAPVHFIHLGAARRLLKSCLELRGYEQRLEKLKAEKLKELGRLESLNGEIIRLEGRVRRLKAEEEKRIKACQELDKIYANTLTSLTGVVEKLRSCFKGLVGAFTTFAGKPRISCL